MNPYAYTQVNIREQDSWVHGDDPVGATEKAIGLVRAGIAKSRNSSDLVPLVVETTSATMVVGAGIAGLRAAIGLADVGLHVYLVEREADARRLGRDLRGDVPQRPGRSRRRSRAWSTRSPSARRSRCSPTPSWSASPAASATTSPRSGSNRETTETIRATVGSIVIATGFDTYEPEAGEFGYGIDGVVTLPEFKAMVDASDGTLTHAGRPVRTIAYIYCVGSRQPAGGNEYCSKYCCAATCHASLEVGKLDPSIHQYHLNRDIRTYGKYELLYTQAREQGAVFMRYPDDTPPTVELDAKGQLDVTDDRRAHPERGAHHPGRPRRPGHRHGPAGERRADRPAQAAGRRRRLLQRDPPEAAPGRDRRRRRHDRRHLPGAEDGVRGVGSGLAAVAQSAAILKKGVAELDPLVAIVHETACTGCGECLAACPYDAIEQSMCDGRNVALIVPSVCKGCGGCVPVCPEDAIDLLGYTDAQMRAMIDGLVEVAVS